MSSTSETITESDATTETKKETDVEFIERMELEEAQEFQKAVEAWRLEKADGRGEAVIMESGGGFGTKAGGTSRTDCAMATPDLNISLEEANSMLREMEWEDESQSFDVCPDEYNNSEDKLCSLEAQNKSASSSSVHDTIVEESGTDTASDFTTNNRKTESIETPIIALDMFRQWQQDVERSEQQSDHEPNTSSIGIIERDTHNVGVEEQCKGWVPLVE